MKFSKKDVISKLNRVAIVPLMYHADIDVCKHRVKACYDAGILAFEFTNRGDNAIEVFKQLAVFVAKDCPDLALGIGTIYDGGTAQSFIDIGAQFIVQPVTSAEVGEVCAKNETVWIPGAMTVTEVHNATLLGADVVKIFPANILGKAYIKALRGPMPLVKLMVTGGVKANKEDVAEWLSAGVNNVGLGGQLFDDPAYSTKIKDVLEEILN
jgi:2-dehydro-3-deoxyphosphogluconate aldolase / (4S)-4-hydroxy-2-oxoglutarate aldolase